MSLEQIAVREIFRQYGDKVKIGRKTIHKPNSRIKMSAQASGSTLTVFAGFSGFFEDIVK